ncbi:unnamed protein product [Rotaria magnacalcarata]|nr:unnamed protein product [Rotaria magnacalcarata]
MCPNELGTTTVNKSNNCEAFDNYTPLTSYHYRPREHASSTTAINSSLTNGHHQSQGLICVPQIEQPQHERLNNEQQQQQQQQQPRRRFQRRKQMKRSKSADLYQEPTSISSKSQNNDNSYFFPSTTNNESNRYHHQQQQSRSRDLIGGGDGNLSPSSSSSSLSTANIERVNRAALLRYKSLDSMTFNNRTANLHGKNNNRRHLSKPINADFDSDDSICGIPKPRK